MLRFSLALGALFALSLSLPLHARPPRVPIGGEAPTLGVRLPAPSLVEANASAIELNPGALGMLDGMSLRLHHMELRDDGRILGTGTAAYLASQLPLVRSLRLGLGLQWSRPSTAMGYAENVKLSFGLAWRPSPFFSLGAALHAFVADGDLALDGIKTADLGLLLTPTRWLAAGVVVQNLATPLYDGLPLQRVYDLELALRPLASRRLEIAAALRIGERRGTFDPRLRLAVEPATGWRLIGDVEMLRRDFARSGDTITDFRASLGLGINLENLGMMVSTLFGSKLDRAAAGPLANAGAGAPFQGMGFSLDVTSRRRLPLVDGGKRLILFSLKGKLTQRKMLGLGAAIRQLERRRDMVGALFDIDGLGAGWGQVQELRSWIKRLRRAGKKTYAYLHAPSSREYYLGAAAETVYLDPDGGVQFSGLAIQAQYFRGFLDLIGIGPQFVRIAEYKGAPEMFTNKGASKPLAKVRQALLDDLFSQLVTDLGADRKKTARAIRAMIDRGPFTPDKALKEGLVDQLETPEKMPQKAQKAAGALLTKPSALFRSDGAWPGGSKVAVIVIEGDIVRGKSQVVPLLGKKVVGDDTIVASLKWAQQSSQVKGIILRVNSPGGSAMASARMWRAVKAAAAAKPLLVSFADIAASGGYFAAAGSKTIYAYPATITGSIGIFTGKFELSKLMEKLGINTETVSHGKRALMNSTHRPYTTEERRFLASRMRYYYDVFIKAVAEARSMAFDKAERLARGRVYTGRQARSRRLIDRYGGLLEAMAEIKRRAGISGRLEAVVLPRQRPSLAQRALKLIGMKSANPRVTLPRALRNALGVLPPSLFLEKANTPMTRLPFRIGIE